ncbi:MAG TPA: XdhC family protein [Acidobacteriaceae bacterium]|nr:XdhC family protein [Acidobacteriaceae bacterium]
MSELNEILALAKRAAAAHEEICVATVVGIEGSAYRRPGARMVLTAAGGRAGTVSGGCLEGEIAKKAWWLTEKGPSLQRYSSFFDDDGDATYGLGCGGTIAVLLERGEPAQQSLEALRKSVEDRTPFVIVTTTDTKAPGTRLILREDGAIVYMRGEDDYLLQVAREALARRTTGPLHGHVIGAFVEYIAPPPALWVFGAGDDAQPLVEFAATLGWHVIVADGRSHLARAERFPQAARMMELEAALAEVSRGDAAVIMTHSYEQDRKALGALLGLGMKYLGVLGPRARTERLVAEVAPRVGLSAAQCISRLHAPVGLDLGGHSPAAIALSIIAELQAVLAGREPRKLTSTGLIHA